MGNGKRRAFTLVELLVVIAIIAILAVALFPAIQSAMTSAHATSMKAKGRTIWLAIASENGDRDAKGECYLWPKDLTREIDNINSASAYFTYLMSDGASIGSIASTIGNQIVKELTRESFVAVGIKAKNSATKIEDNNNAWSVAVVGDDDNPMDALFISRNVSLGKSVNRAQDAGSGSKLQFREVKPFGSDRAVWVTRSGAVRDVREMYLKSDLLFAVIKDDEDSDNSTVDIWQNNGG